ncbi:hypothetical protein X797_000199 [Metarhizium robertsii]|uniref:Uncharacterized protein n=1 Tax=Metarhizium robertsii TaxID=568076 RepID=A0A0A1V5N9_9HYPO|nr:hypothetical protein X797_000199 [Metarhizium robertsii]
MHAGVAISGRYVLSMRQAALPLPPLDGLHVCGTAASDLFFQVLVRRDWRVSAPGKKSEPTDMSNSPDVESNYPQFGRQQGHEQQAYPWQQSTLDAWTSSHELDGA